MKKIIKVIVSTFLISFVLLIGLFFSSEWLFPEWHGSHDLGNNLYMMDWERGNKIVVYCGNKDGRTCYGGAPVIPHNYPREVWVKCTNSNTEWIIVKAEQVSEKKYSYYIINKDFDIEGLDWQKANCDSIIQSHIVGPLDSITFSNELERHKIDLDFSH